MMVGSLEVDIEDVCNTSLNNSDVIDDFEEEHDEKCSSQFHNMEVNIKNKFNMSTKLQILFLAS